MSKERSQDYTGKGKDGAEVTLHVRRPTPKQYEKARMTFNATFRKALESGAMLKQKLETYMREQNLWDDAKQSKVSEILAILTTGQVALEKGGIKLNEAKDIALKMSNARAEMIELLQERNALEANTAEGQAQNMEFNHLVSLCTVYNLDGKPYYNSLDEYLEDDSEIALKSAQSLASLIYNTEESRLDLPENKFLVKYKFVDEKLRFIDKQGRLVDSNGRLVDEEGNFINEAGERVDGNGELLKETVFAPFLDDEGKPLQ